MAVRHLEGENWQSTLQRIRDHSGSLLFAWAAVPNASDDEVLAITVRGGKLAEPVHYVYERLEIRREVVAADVAAQRLEAGIAETSRVSFQPPDRHNDGAAYWVSRNNEMPHGKTAPIARPAYYFAAALRLGATNPLQAARLTMPLSGRGQPYWPKASDAIYEVLYGVTRHHGRRDIGAEVIVHLPYMGPHFSAVEWSDDGALLTTVGDLPPASSPPFTVHFLWTLRHEDPKLHREVEALGDEAVFTTAMDAPPTWYALGLIDPDGVEVDAVEGSIAVDQAASDDSPLPAEALFEALDFFASVWRNVFSLPLFRAQEQLTPLTSLSVPVATRSDFESRLSQLDALIKSIDVPEHLVDARDPNVKKSMTLNRLDSALKVRLGETSSDYAAATKAIRELRKLNDLRNAVQHPHTSGKDLPSALSAVNLPFPPNWPLAWNHLRHVVIASLRDLRLALTAAL